MAERDDRSASGARESACALALVLGALGATIAMAFHPTGRDLFAATGRDAAVMRDRFVHGVAIAALLLQSFGVLGVVRALRGPRLGWAELGYVAHAAATLSGMVAAVASGFVAPMLIDGVLASDPVEHAAADAVWHGNGAVNQAFARVWIVTGCAAIGLWSIAGRRRWPRLSTFGAVLAVLVVAMLLVGHLRLDVHGVGAVVLGQTVWVVCVARALLRPAFTSA